MTLANESYGNNNECKLRAWRAVAARQGEASAAMCAFLGLGFIHTYSSFATITGLPGAFLGLGAGCSSKALRTCEWCSVRFSSSGARPFCHYSVVLPSQTVPARSGFFLAGRGGGCLQAAHLGDDFQSAVHRPAIITRRGHVCALRLCSALYMWDVSW